MNEDERALSRERAMADEIQRLSDLTVAELIAERPVIQVRIGCNRDLQFTLDLQAMVEGIAETGI